LQHNCLLSDDEVRDHGNLAAREFKRVMMNVRIVKIELPKPSNFVIHARHSGTT